MAALTPRTAVELIKKPVHYLIEHHSRKIAIAVTGLVARRVLRWYRTLTPKHCVLELHLPSDMVIVDDIQPELSFLSDATTLRSLTHTLETAGNDPRVRGLLLRLGVPRFSSLAMLTELREALELFKAKGKPIVVFADSLSRFEPAPALFYLASVATTIVMTPLGSVFATDPFVAVPFIKTMLAKLGIVAQMDSRSEYKNFKDFMTETEMSPAYQEAVQSYVTEMMNILIAGIAQGRGMTPAAVRALFDSGPHTAPAAKAAGLIDMVAYRDQVYDDILPTACGLKSKELMDLRFFATYAKSKSHLSPWNPPATLRTLFLSPPPQIAVIYLAGNIMPGRSNANLDGTSPSIGSDTACMLIRSAANDKSIAGIVIRIDSGGGDAIASDLILREILQARQRGKKVVVSMVGLAASGGYFVACGADRIVAHPSTLTGSIGVVFGKLVLRELLTDKLGIDFDTRVQTGEGGRLMTVLEPFSERGKNWSDEILNDFYKSFKERVAAGRSLTMDQVEEIARGRVWTGSQALERKLVDRLGSMRAALDEMKALLSLAPSAPVRVRRFPELSMATLLNPPRNSNEEKSHLMSQSAPLSAVYGLAARAFTALQMACALMFAPSGSGASVVQEMMQSSAGPAAAAPAAAAAAASSFAH